MEEETAGQELDPHRRYCTKQKEAKKLGWEAFFLPFLLCNHPSHPQVEPNLKLAGKGA